MTRAASCSLQFIAPNFMASKEKALAEVPTRAFLLAYKDSNLDRQNQNLMCYRYTIGQTSKRFFEKQGKGITILHF